MWKMDDLEFVMRRWLYIPRYRGRKNALYNEMWRKEVSMKSMKDK